MDDMGTVVLCVRGWSDANTLCLAGDMQYREQVTALCSALATLALLLPERPDAKEEG